MIFANYHEYETALEQLKNDIKLQVTEVLVNNILEQQWHGVYDVWGILLEVTEPAFLQFTKGHKKEWCDKMAFSYETAFDSVVKVYLKTTNDLKFEDLHLFIHDFFDDGDVFFEDWFTCSKCFKSTHCLSDDTNLCTDCEDSTTEK